MIRLLLIFLWLFTFAKEISCQDKTLVEPCETYIKSYCKQDKDIREIVKCLFKNESKLNSSCKQEIQRYSQVNRQTSGPMGNVFGMLNALTGAVSQLPIINYEGRFIGSKDQSPSVTESLLNATVPFYKDQGKAYSALVNMANVHLGAPVKLGEDKKDLPENYYLTEVGLGYSNKVSDKKTIGMRGTVGYVGDRITDRTKTFSISGNYSIRSNESESWVFMLMISYNNPLGAFIPIPGFFYIYKSPTLVTLLGLPIVSVQWTPINLWSFSFSYFLPQLKLEANYGAADNVQLFTGFTWRQQRYILSENPNHRERLTFEEKTLDAGMRSSIMQGLFSELQSGFSFNRYIYLGRGLFDKKGGQKDLDSNWYLKWSVRMLF